MFKKILSLFTLSAGIMAGTSVKAQELIHYWNFNNSESVENLFSPAESSVMGASITHIEGGSSAVLNTSNTGQDFDLENLNARNGDLAMSHLRFNDPVGGSLVFNLPTVGYQDVVVKYASRRSGSGAGIQVISYSLNGLDYSVMDDKTITTTPTLFEIDFSGIEGVDDNPNLIYKLARKVDFMRYREYIWSLSYLSTVIKEIKSPLRLFHKNHL